MKLSRLLATVAFIFISLYSVGQSRQQDSLALVSVYNATVGSNWTNKTNWLSTQIGVWNGVTLNSSKRVFRVRLQNNNLTGNIPHRIGVMSSLTELILTNNHLSGAISDSIGRLSNLATLDLSGNRFTGSLPISIGALPNLTTLTLDNNLLHGNLPVLSGAASLRELTVTHNKLTFAKLAASGLLPADIDVFQYAPQDTILALDTAIIAGNLWVVIDNDASNRYKWYKGGVPITESTRVIIPPGEGAYRCEVTNTNYPDLTLTSSVLNFGYTEESDSVALVALYNATKGSGWTNHTNWLSGNMSTWYGITLDGNRRVTAINLSGNNLNGTLPVELGNLSKLVTLKINGNKIRGNLPSLSENTELTTFWVQNNRLYFSNLTASEITPADVTSYTYQPQDTIIPLSFDQFDSELTVEAVADGNDVYSWYRSTVGIGNLTQTIPVETEGSYNCVLTNTVYSALTLYTDTIAVAFSTVSDSIALVHLYNETNGAQWTNHSNWLTGKINTWFGVTLDGSRRVQKLLLPRNKLAGTITPLVGNLTHLTQLNLSNNELSGHVPTEIENLTQLTILRLYSNQLTGTIPTGINRLTLLTELGLHSNQLTGTIPSGITSLTALQSLKLGHNLLTGTIPTNINTLNQLTWLAMNDNQFSGTIPSNIGNITTLTGLELDGNQLTGAIPTQLGNLTGLIHLSLNDNLLTGTIPATLGNCTHLSYLSLAGNGLTGSIPPGITSITGLVELHLGHNQLSGTIPTAIGYLTSLTNLDLSKNRFTGSLPTEIESLTGLITLEIDSNFFVGDLPLLSNAAYLSELSANNNLYTFSNLIAGDVLPSDIDLYTYTPQDTAFSLSYNLIASTLTVNDDDEANNEFSWYRGAVQLPETSKTVDLTLEGTYRCEVINPLFPDLTIPSDSFVYSYTLKTDSVALVAFYDSTGGASSWSTKTNWLTGPLNSWYGVTLSGGRVSRIVLNGNNLSGSIPPEIGSLTHVKVLQLQNNSLHGTIPAEIGEMDSITDLRLNNNQLTGPIPSVSNLSKMSTLYLNNNQLSGTIPSSMGSLTKLIYLGLNNNQLSGSVPASMGGLVLVQTLNLSMNQLSGTIPAGLGNLSLLQNLYLNNNTFSGSIPVEFGNLMSLRTLNVSGNTLTGVIPTTLGNLDNLRELNVSGNRLSGPIPTDLEYLSSVTKLSIANNKFVFTDIEPIFSWSNYTGFQSQFTYSPQDSIGVEETVAGYDGQPLVLSINGYTPAAHDRFQWYKNDVRQTGMTSPTFEVPTFSVANEGVYHCVVTNTTATALTLYSRDITVEKHTIPVDLSITNVTLGNGQSNCYGALQNITVAGSGTTVNLQSGASATYIAGNSIRFLPGFHAFSGSYVDASITTTASFCEPVQPIVYNDLIEKSIVLPEKERSVIEKNVDLKIYPNPNNGRFTIEMSGFAEGAMLSVIDMKGRVVGSQLIDNTQLASFDIQAIEKGIYFVRVSDGSHSLNRKMVVW
jgi:Leucine-rich repeat (LRR) protein